MKRQQPFSRTRKHAEQLPEMPRNIAAIEEKMRSIGTAKNVEVRHFMDDEHQITIGIDRDLWPIVQGLANQAASERQWLGGKGSDGDHLNLWIIGHLARCPKGVEAHDWVSQAVK